MKLISSAQAATQSLGEPIEGPGTLQQGLTTTGAAGTALTDFLSTIITTLTVVASVAFAIYFIIGGLKRITSSGDKAKTAEAGDQMVQAAIGLIVVVVSYFIIGIVGQVIGLDILDPVKILGI